MPFAGIKPVVSETTSPSTPSSDERRWHESFWGRFLLFAAVQAFAHAILALGSACRSFPLDDAYIHLVYAEGISYGEVLSYNAGVPAAGSTSPAWALFLAPLVGIGLRGSTLVLAVKLYGSLLAVGSALVTERVFRDSLGRLALFAGALIAIDPALTMGAFSGMELSLVGFSSALWFAAYRRRALSSTDRLSGWLVLLSSVLLVWSRPELILLPLGVCMFAFEARRLRLEQAAGATLGAGLWGLWCNYASGSWLPTTFHAKHQAAHLLQHFADLGDVLHQAAGGGFSAIFFALALLLAGRLTKDSLWNELKSANAMLGVLALLSLGLAWAHDFQQPERFYWTRYALTLRPIFLLSLFACLSTRNPADFSRAPAGVLVALALGSLGSLVEHRQHLQASARNIAELNVAAADYVREHTGEREWVASNDAGAIRLLSGRPTIDLLGLNEASLLTENGRSAALQARSPKYLIVFPSWFPNLVRRYPVEARFESEPYAICDCEQSELVVLRYRD